MEYIIIFVLFIVTIFVTYLFVRTLMHIISGYGVPFVPTSDFKLQKLLDIIEWKSGDTFLDIWSGDGKIVQAVSEKFPDLKCTGIENSYFPYKLSLSKKEKSQGDYEILKKDFFKEDFSKYSIIYSYTISYLMEKIWKKIQAECKPGTLFYSNSFEIKNQKYYKKIAASETSFIYIYKV